MTRSQNQSRLNRGFMLLEALIGMLIFSLGVLGLVGLQATMTKSQTASKYRADAAYLATELIGTMWADQRSNLSKYTASATCDTYDRCKGWTNKVALMLPSSAATVTVVSNVVTITINWKPADDDRHQFQTSTSIVK